jgi:translation initiation factor 3 subunit G
MLAECLAALLSNPELHAVSSTQELFQPFGQISRIYIAYDRETGESRGFAFVNFVHREDAARAVERLDGYGYDNLILRVEFAAPREQRP